MRVVVIGDGPGGLSAALFLAKAGTETHVYGQDKTAMHWALLRNYPGIFEIHGSEFQRILREQVTRFGGHLHAERVATLTRHGAAFEVTLESGQKVEAEYVVLSEGKSPRLAQQLGLEFDEATGVPTDVNSRTTIRCVYAVGRLHRPGRSQAVISAGDGAAAAIDILSTVRGEPYTDWESPPEGS